MSVRAVNSTPYGTIGHKRDVSGEGSEKIELVAKEAFNENRPIVRHGLSDHKYRSHNSHSNLLIACGVINVIMGYACWILALRTGSSSTHGIPIMLISLGALFLGRGLGRKESLDALEKVSANH